MKMFDTPLDWYHAFQQARDLYVERLYRNNLVPPEKITPMAGDSRPLYLSSAPFPVASPNPDGGALQGVGGNGAFTNTTGYDEAWRLSVTTIPTTGFMKAKADDRRWNPPYIEVAAQHLELKPTGPFGPRFAPISSKALLFQDDNYFWFKGRAWSTPVRDVFVGPVSPLAPTPP
jgi:hypothetical protein